MERSSRDHGGEEFWEGHGGGLCHAIPNSEKGRRESTEKVVLQRGKMGKEKKKNFFKCIRVILIRQKSHVACLRGQLMVT